MVEETNKKCGTLQDSRPNYRTGNEIEPPSTLDDALSLTPWERIQANDDMMNFGEMLRRAMEKRNAESR